MLFKKRPKPMVIKNHMDNWIDPDRKVLYRNFHDIGDKFKIVYLVEISRNHNKMFIVLFPNFEKPDIFINLNLPIKVGENLLNKSQNVFENFIGTFSIKYGKLLLSHYHGHQKV